MAASSSTDMEGISEVVMAEDCLLMIGSALKPCIKNAAPGSIPECTRKVRADGQKKNADEQAARLARRFSDDAPGLAQFGSSLTLADVGSVE